MPIGIYPRTEFHRKLCSEASKGIKRSTEFKNKVSLGMKRYLATHSVAFKKRLDFLVFIRKDKNAQEKKSKSNSEATKEQWRTNKNYRNLMVNLGRSRIGKLSFSWKGGKSFEPYTPNFNNQLKDRIRVRDNFLCRLCGIPELECYEKLHIHHIDYDKKNCKEDNLISLCRRCHVRTNFRRENWRKTFSQMLHA